MTDLTIFNNEQFGSVRTTEIDGTPYFVGKDIAEALGYVNAQKAIRDHVDDEDKTVNDSFTANGTEIILINESGLYSMILSSKLPKAKEFKRWVTAEVLPTIHRTGCYHIGKQTTVNTGAVQDTNARIRTAKALMEFTKIETLSESQRNALISKSVEILTGQPLSVTPTPIHEKTYSASEVGNRLGVSAQRIGKLANENNMKTPEYGEWYKDKSPYSSKEVETFRYNEKAVERFRTLLNKTE